MAVPGLNSAVNWRHTLLTSLKFTELVPGVQIIEHGRKINEEKKLGETREGKWEDSLALAPVFPPFFPVVFPAYDVTHSTI